MREISLLRCAKTEHVVKLLDVAFKQDCNHLHVVAVLEYAEHDLLGVIARGVRFGPRSVRHVFKEIVAGVGELHQRGIFHRDLKTANILLGKDRRVRITDLGMSERLFLSPNTHNARLRRVLRQSVALLHRPESRSQPARCDEPCVGGEQRSFFCEATTLLYRAPEQLMKVESGYSHPADIWSLGCILLELLLGRPFFLAAKNADHLLTLMLKLFGEGAFTDYAEGVRSAIFQQKEKAWKYACFNEYLTQAGIDDTTRDLLVRMMQVDPVRRPSAAEILGHSFFTASEPESEPEDYPVIPQESHELQVRQAMAKLRLKRASAELACDVPHAEERLCKRPVIF